MIIPNDLTLVDNETLYNEFFTPLFRYIFFRTKDHEIANDLTQTSFLKFLQNNPNLSSREHASRLLYTIARNTLIDYWRVENKKSYIDIEEIEDLPSDILNQEDEIILQQDKEFINDILKDLSEIERDIVSMRLSGEEDYKTIASVLGISVSNARKIYSRIIRKLEVVIKNSNYFR